MREHKFRAWYENKMHRVTNLHVETGMVTIPLMRFPFTQDVIPDEIVEYTGLKDKNGKEIYEGDLVELLDIAYQVMWKDGAYHLSYYQSNQSGNQFTQDRTKRFEVVGNIYENPELS